MQTFDPKKINKIINELSRIEEVTMEKGDLDPKDVVTDFISKFDKDTFIMLNLMTFIRKIKQIIILNPTNLESRLRKEFILYKESIEERFTSSDDRDRDDHFDQYEGEFSILPRKVYEKEKYSIQIELLKLQEWVVKNNKRIAIVFEGRDAAGKGSTIKRFIEYLNPRYYRVIALGVPTQEEKNNWFDRYEKHLPKDGEIVFFDRSWYNRAVVEPVMGYCDKSQYESFMENVVKWEENLIDDGLILFKFWFSITKEKQTERFRIRQESPLKYWKFSPNDAKVVDKFEAIGDFKNEMFQKTSTTKTPWVVINSNDKKVGRLNAMRYVISKLEYHNKDKTQTKWYPEVVNILLK